MVNRYPGSCAKCGSHVSAKAGACSKVNGAWRVFHLACRDGGSVVSITFNSGHTITRNARGTCEDAPCCGCCS